MPNTKITLFFIVLMMCQQSYAKSDYTNSIGQKFVLIKAGSFMMGVGRGKSLNNTQMHRVKLTKNYYIQTTEVTQKQWYSIMKTKPWLSYRYSKLGPDYPVTNISWREVKIFIRKLKKKENTSKYRLPSEAEWEYACRAGSNTNYCFGSNDSDLGDYAWFTKNAYDVREDFAHQVMKKKPNKWGLYDMHGNVDEFCEDRVDKHVGFDIRLLDCRDIIIYKNGVAIDPVCRKGGNWLVDANQCKSGERYGMEYTDKGETLGFRLVMDVKEVPEDDPFNLE